MILEYVIPGPPQPKERPRRGRLGRWYTPDATKRYERHVKGCAVAAKMAHGECWPMGAAYRVKMLVWFQDLRRRDLDNVVKAVLDGLNGVLWDDDSQVVELSIGRAVDRDRPRVDVVVEVVR